MKNSNYLLFCFLLTLGKSYGGDFAPTKPSKAPTSTTSIPSGGDLRGLANKASDLTELNELLKIAQIYSMKAFHFIRGKITELENKP